MVLPLADRKANVEANRRFAQLQDALGCIFDYQMRNLRT